MPEAVLNDLGNLLDGIADRVHDSPRRPFLLGISGPPASGKSTLAEKIANSLPAQHGVSACCCPMDGYHFSSARLEQLGLRASKGRIDTFDAQALLGSLQRLRSGETPFWWPVYSRELHEPVAEGVRITGDIELFVIEGNYIFADAPVWSEIAAIFDLRIFVDAPDEVLRERLLQRHLAGGRSRAEATDKIGRIDMANAHGIRRSAVRSDLRSTIRLLCFADPIRRSGE